MSNKEIRIRWLSDDSEIDKSIQRLQQKMTQMNRTSGQMQNIQETGGTLSKRAEYAQKQFQKSSEYVLQKESRELEQRQRKETLALMEKQRELGKIEKMEGRITAERQKQMDMLKAEINLKSQQVMDIEVTKQQIDRNLKDLKGGEQSPSGAGGNGGVQQNKAMEMFKDILKSIGVASVINGALNFTQHRVERDRKLLADQGTTASLASRELREQIQGQGSRGLFFAGERKQAMDMAAQEQSGMKNLDLAKILGGVAGGAMAGTLIPGVGNLAGGLIGGAGAFMGMMGGSDRMYNRMFDQDAYKQMMTREGMQKYEANRKMLELQNPLKTIAFETMQKDMDKNISLERGLGLQGRALYGEEERGPTTPSEIQAILDTPMKNRRTSRNVGFDTGRGTRFNIPSYESTGLSPLEGGLQGSDINDMLQPDMAFDFTKAGRGAGDERGFLRNAMTPYGTEYGFQRDDVENSIQSLVGAGATTEGARGMAGQALQFQRNLRLENAPQIMGQLSGAGMETSQTEQATIKLMAEATKLGIDASKMPQEMQRMTAVTAQLATSGGGFSQSAIETYGAGVTEFSQSGIQGAKGAFDEMLTRAKGAGGFEGQMGMGFLMGEGAQEAFGAKGAKTIKGDSKLMNTLNQLSTEDLEKDPALAKGLAQQMDISTQELIAGMKKKDEFKQTRTGTQQSATLQLGQAIKGMRPEEISKFIEGEGSELYSKVAQEDIAAYGTAESGKGRGGRRASIVGRANRLAGNVSGVGAATEDSLRDQLTSDEGLSPTEINRGARATGDMARLDTVNKHLDDLTSAAKKHSTSAELYNQHFDKFVQYAKESGDALEKMSGQLQQVVEMLEQEGIVSAAPSK